MGLFKDLKGTTESIFRVGVNAWKNITGGIAARNAADNADVKVQASQFETTGNTGLIINADAANTGADWSITIKEGQTSTLIWQKITISITKIS